MTSELTDGQRKQFKKQLSELSANLREEIRQEIIKYDDERYQELANRVPDLEDESVADLLTDLKLADIDRHINELRDIDAAMLRIADYSYGACIDCNSPIDIERLQAYPTAKRCILCQTQYEKTHAGHRFSSI